MPRFDSSTVHEDAFQHVDACVDSFARIADIASDRLYGQPGGGAPWLSVVIPTYRRGELFREALESVLGQAPAAFSWECVVVDNTPLDEKGLTPALAAVRDLGDGRVSYWHNRDDLGSGYNWNRGAELARGEWLCFLHDDDVLCPDALANIGRQIRAYRGRRPLGYLHARREDFTGSFVPPESRHFPPERLTRAGMVISGCTGAGAPTCGTAILRKAYLETGGINYDFGPSADAVLCYQIMKNYAVVCSDRVLGGYRWGDNETLKKQALLALVRADELLSAYAYGQSPFGRWWGRRFGAASCWRNVRRKQKIAERYGVSVSGEEFGRACTYPEPSKAKKTLFLGLYAAYRLLRLADGWIQAAAAYRSRI